MRSTAELNAEAGDLDHPDDIAVLLAEERHGAHGPRRLDRLLLNQHRHVPQHRLIRQPLDLLQIIHGDRRRMREIEAQAVWLDHRAALHHVLAQDRAERRVEEVRCGVRARQRDPALGVHRGGHRHADRQLAALHAGAMKNGAIPPDGIQHARAAARPAQVG